MKRRGNAGARRKSRERAGFKLPVIAWRRALPGLIAVGAALAVFWLLRMALNQPLREVTVAGYFQRVSALDVEKAVRGTVMRQGLVAVDLDEVRRIVEQMPWVDSATVARRWPYGLSIFITEQTPIARWGETGLVNTRGELFVNDARHVPAELPELVGPAGAESLMTARYLASQGRLVAAGLRLSELKLDARGAWEIQLDSGVALRLGRTEVEARFERFMQTAARIVATRATEIDYVDLRYSNGFAVGWRRAQPAARNEVNRG